MALFIDTKALLHIYKTKIPTFHNEKESSKLSKMYMMNESKKNEATHMASLTACLWQGQVPATQTEVKFLLAGVLLVDDRMTIEFPYRWPASSSY